MKKSRHIHPVLVLAIAASLALAAQAVNVNGEWEMKMTTPRGEFTVTYTGKVEGDTMKGQTAMGDMGAMDWTAARKKP